MIQRLLECLTNPYRVVVVTALQILISIELNGYVSSLIRSQLLFSFAKVSTAV